MLLFEKTVVQRGKNVEATREGLKVMIFTGYFGKDATSNFFYFFIFLEKPDILVCRCMVNLMNQKESDDSKITELSRQFPEAVLQGCSQERVF